MITIIDIINIRNLDLNLLVIFEDLYKNLNVSKAALEVQLTQSAMSNALNRLRHMFNDKLFRRVQRGVSPTPKAHELAPKISASIEGIKKNIFTEEKFDPSRVNKQLKMNVSTYFELTALPNLFPIFQKTSPELRLSFVPSPIQMPVLELKKGDYDLAIAGYYSKVPLHY